MLLFLLGLILFFGVHHIRILPGGLRDAGIARLGANGWKGAYALVSLIGLVLIVLGWMEFRPEANEVFDPPTWGRHAAHTLVLIGFILLAAAYTPLGRIKKIVRHPMSIGVALWALSHLLVNGDQASLWLFGAFFLSSVVHVLTAKPVDHPESVKGWTGDLGAIGIGILMFAMVAFWLHGVLFGVSPF